VTGYRRGRWSSGGDGPAIVGAALGVVSGAGRCSLRRADGSARREDELRESAAGVDVHPAELAAAELVELLVNAENLVDARQWPGAKMSEEIAELLEHPLRIAVVGIVVVAVEVAERCDEAVRSLFEYCPLMGRSAIASVKREADRQAEFEGHVEPWHPPMPWNHGRLDARDVVDRVGTPGDQRHQAAQTIPRGRKLDHAARREAESDETGDQCEEQRLIRAIERDVDEDVSGR
jgi:hypothetical protein